jgi:hypothetical protein
VAPQLPAQSAVTVAKVSASDAAETTETANLGMYNEHLVPPTDAWARARIWANPLHTDAGEIENPAPAAVAAVTELVNPNNNRSAQENIASPEITGDNTSNPRASAELVSPNNEEFAVGLYKLAVHVESRRP